MDRQKVRGAVRRDAYGGELAAVVAVGVDVDAMRRDDDVAARRMAVNDAEAAGELC